MYLGLTTDIARRVFPFTPAANLERYLPSVAQAAQDCLADRTILLLALATIRAEAENFVPHCEPISRYNTSLGGTPFDLYDNRRELGNRGSPDGERFRGRGYIQLTGRKNYARMSAALLFDLLQCPEIADKALPAAQILFRFVFDKQEKLRQFSASGDWATTRRLVNGGFHGVARFREAFLIADSLLPPC